MTDEQQNGISLDDLNLAKDCDVPYRFQVESPKTGRPIDGVFFSVYGDQSDRVTSFIRRELNKRRADEAQRAARGRNSKEYSTVEDDEEFAIESCVIRMAGWEGIVEPFTADNARKLFRMNADLRTQVLRESGTVANFTKV